MRERERAFAVARENRLRVGKDRRAGSRVARMTDRHVTGEPREHAFTEDIGHQSHAAV